MTFLSFLTITICSLLFFSQRLKRHSPICEPFLDNKIFCPFFILSSSFHFYADVIELPSDKCCTTLDEVGRKEWSNRWSIAKCGKAAAAITKACWLLLVQLLQCSWKFPPSSLMICFGRNFREMILFCSKSCWGWCSTLHYWKQWPLFTIIAILHLKLLSFWVFSINTCNGTTHVLSPRSHCSTTFFLLSFGSSSSSHTQSMYTLCYFPQKYFKT